MSKYRILTETDGNGEVICYPQKYVKYWIPIFNGWERILDQDGVISFRSDKPGVAEDKAREYIKSIEIKTNIINVD